MIRKLVIRRFKRFFEETFEFSGHVVLAGPNNTGKTTVLQAIAAWELAFNRWRSLNDFQKYAQGEESGHEGHEGEYVKAPLARQAFYAVPLRSFEMLWHGGEYRKEAPIEIEIQWGRLWTITMEFIPDTTEQIYVRPKADIAPARLQKVEFTAVYVPPLSGVSLHEPAYTMSKQLQLLGQGKSGDIIRNLLSEAYFSAELPKVQDAIRQWFDYELLDPFPYEADIMADYKYHPDGPQLDITNVGSGFLQMLMLFAFLHTRKASVYLLDEPDAHLHVLLQDAIYHELRSIAAKQKAQLVIASHAEVFINAVEPEELCYLAISPRMIKTTQERAKLIKSLGIITNTDLVLAENAPGVLFVEGHTDIAILREWAKTLNHPAYETLRTLFWKPTVSDTRLGAPGISAKDYYDALTMVRDDLPALELLDGDGNPRIPETPIRGRGFQRLRWRRYEIESYLVHPAVMERFIEQKMAEDGKTDDVSAQNKQKVRTYFQKQLPAVWDEPLGEHLVLEGLKASSRIIPAILAAADIHGVEKRDFYEIAAMMLPEEIHPEVIEKLDAIQKAFRL